MVLRKGKLRYPCIRCGDKFERTGWSCKICPKCCKIPYHSRRRKVKGKIYVKK